MGQNFPLFDGSKFKIHPFLLGQCLETIKFSGREKTIFGALPHLNFAFWGLAVAGIAYLIPNWHQMELVFSVPLVGLYVTYWVLPESPRWLLSQGRTQEAENIIKKIAQYNGKPLGASFKLVPPEGASSGNGILGFLQLFKTPYLRMKVFTSR